MVKIRARAPLRLGLAGGGSDVSPFCDEHGGCVLNVTIDRYAFASIEPSAEGGLSLSATDLGMVDRPLTGRDQPLDDSTGLRLHRGVINRMAKLYGDGAMPEVKLTTYVESPMGSGLGSSSALVVAMVKAMLAYYDRSLTAYEIARLAFDIERKDLGLRGGRQDQYAAAFGGINLMNFGANDQADVTPVPASNSMMHELEASLVLLFTGASRESSTVIERQAEALTRGGSSLEAMHNLKREAGAMHDALLNGDLTDIATVLDRGWEAKKATSPAVSTPQIESALAAAKKIGALAGKVSGAGGGGFIMFITPPEERALIIRTLEEGSHGDCMTGRFVTDGALSWTTPNRAG
jgi:D-glycero-alpha-D-manno-heptose-7-phosphate kinase